MMLSPDFDTLNGRVYQPMGFVQAMDLGGDGGRDFVADLNYLDQGLVPLGITPSAISVGDGTAFTGQGYSAYGDLDGDGDDDVFRLVYQAQVEVWLSTPGAALPVEPQGMTEAERRPG